MLILNPLQRRALDALSHRWQTFADLSPFASYHVFDELAQAGAIECRIMPILKNGHKVGSLHEYKLKG